MQTTNAPLSSLVLVCSCSRGLIRPVSASLQSREAPHKQLSCSSSALRVARWEFQTCVVSWDIDKTAKFMEAYWCRMVGVPGSGWALEWDLVIGYSRNQSLKQPLFF
ncbi:hypothetical protein LEMLEM_LOCUS7570 [Lemmus lemmus]